MANFTDEAIEKVQLLIIELEDSGKMSPEDVKKFLSETMDFVQARLNELDESEDG